MTAEPADARLAALEAENRALTARVADLESALTAWGQSGGDGLRRLLEAVMDAFPGTVHVKDRDDRYEFVNRFFTEYWGVTREKCLGHTPVEVFGDLGYSVAERDRIVLATKRALPYYEVDYPQRDGRRVIVLSTKVPLLDAAGEVEHIVTVGLDVSSLRLAEAKQRTSELLMRSVVEAALDGIVITDSGGRVLAFNPAAEALFGVSRAAMLGDERQDGAPLETFGLAGLLGAERVARRLEAELRRADGSLFPAEVTVTRANLEENDAWIATIRDLTERRGTEARLAEQQQALHQSEKLGALGSLLAGVAHELNNPLSVVLAQTALLKETATDARTAERGERIYTAAERCARIVRSFLAIARQRTPEYAAVPFGQVLRTSLELTSYGLRSSGIGLEIDLAPNLPPVWGDADQLGQVVMNLVVNAQQALQERRSDRRLRIAAQPDGAGWVRVTVADNGPGIPDAIRSKIFDPFFTTKPVGKGTGVGLSVCLGIVQSHGGSLRAEESAGGGATFVMLLPTAQAEGASAVTAPMPEEIPAPSPTAILIVDDEPDIAQLLSEIVAPMASRVDIAENGAVALRYLREHPYHLVMSDLRMPELDGPGLLRELRGLKLPQPPAVLFITGDTLHHNLESFLDEIGSPVIEKPFLPSEVRRRVSELLDARRTQG
ncbi:MAG TPA: ATP-binding protein [Beijerinckiaceae bacterium]|jgi:two-component system NtrC family sensor kinase